MKLPKLLTWYLIDDWIHVPLYLLSLSLSLCRDVGGRTCFLDMEYEYFTKGCFEGALSNIHVDVDYISSCGVYFIMCLVPLGRCN